MCHNNINSSTIQIPAKEQIHKWFNLGNRSLAEKETCVPSITRKVYGPIIIIIKIIIIIVTAVYCI